MTTKHEQIKARDLRDGDLMRIGSSTNYVLVAETEDRDGRVAVTIYDGTVPNPNGPTLCFAPAASVDLARRNATP